MGLFDLFKGSAKAEGKPRPKGNPAAKWADRVEKRAQNYDRQEAIQALSELGTRRSGRGAAQALHLPHGPVDHRPGGEGRGVPRHPPRRAATPSSRCGPSPRKAESLAWPMKIIKALVDEGEYVEELLRWLSRWDTEYAKFVDPKVQILAALEEHRHPRIREEVERFLEDVNEPARFHAADDAPRARRRSSRCPRSRSSCSTRRASASAPRWPRASRRAAWPLPEDDRAAVRNVLPRLRARRRGSRHQALDAPRRRPARQRRPPRTRDSGGPGAAPLDSGARAQRSPRRDSRGRVPRARVEDGYSLIFGVVGNEKPRSTVTSWLNLNVSSSLLICPSGKFPFGPEPRESNPARFHEKGRARYSTPNETKLLG